MKSTIIKYFLFVIVLVSPISVLAWDDTGHKTAAHIAWENMTPEVRENASKLLLATPEDSGLSQLFLTSSRSLPARQNDLFDLASTWADIVRDRKFAVRFKNYNHGPWHYNDIFWRDVNGKAEIVEGLENDKENVVERLFALEKVLIDKNQPESERGIALAWILHLAGDIHQPLHCSGRVTEMDPKGDQGGNLFELTPKDTPREKRENLHWYWDSIVTKSIPRKNDSCDADYVPMLAKQFTKKFPKSRFEGNLKTGKYDEWLKEGYEKATKFVYPNLVRGQTPSESYRKTAYLVSEEAISLAGYRMAEMLNQDLKN